MYKSSPKLYRKHKNTDKRRNIRFIKNTTQVDFLTVHCSIKSQFECLTCDE